MWLHSTHNHKTIMCQILSFSQFRYIPVDRTWSTWSEWSSCATCYDGVRTRNRACGDPEYMGSKTCSGASLETKTCRIKSNGEHVLGQERCILILSEQNRDWMSSSGQYMCSVNRVTKLRLYMTLLVTKLFTSFTISSYLHL
jgi:hypothetical protein